MAWNFVDLTGERFCKLTVLERANDKLMPNGTKAVRWKCKCDCGTIKDIYVSSLRNGQKSCGCGKKINDITGKVFGELTVLCRGKDDINCRGYKIPTWICKCTCGKEVTIRDSYLRSGNTKSCGHLRGELASLMHRKHGKRNERIYSIWKSMNGRCNDKFNENYGGRGIEVCEEWKESFQAFYDWSMANGYSDELTIDRINNDGNYEPSNCRWATDKQQARNTRHNRLFDYNGERRCLSEWCEIFGVKYNTAHSRITRGAITIDDICRPVQR